MPAADGAYLQTDEHYHVAAAAHRLERLHIARRKHVHQLLVNCALDDAVLIHAGRLAFYGDSILYFFAQLHHYFQIHIGLRPSGPAPSPHVKQRI